MKTPYIGYPSFIQILSYPCPYPSLSHFLLSFLGRSNVLIYLMILYL